jgi:uncharacterized protein (DUF1015 family)
MAIIRPFRALRPTGATVARIAAVPYDVVNTQEARALAQGNPLSFLHVSRAEIDLPPDTDPYSDAVYARALDNFNRLRREAPLVEEAAPALYFYRLIRGSHAQTGLVACYSVDEYERGLIKKHERTRRDKEDDRTRHITALRAQTGPVFLTYRASEAVDAVADRVTACPPLFDFTAADGVRHTVWTVAGEDLNRVVKAFAELPCLYIADGHHRAASAARTRKYLAEHGGAEADWFQAVAFPDNQVNVLPYNRVVKDLAGLTPDAFLAEVRRRFTMEPGTPSPAKKGEASIYLGGKWYRIRLADKAQVGAPSAAGALGSAEGDAGSVIGNLDVSLLQDRLLAPVLKIADARTDKRIDFVGGIRGTGELEKLVNQGKAAVAFSMFPVGVDDLMRIADAGEIMPPKSTWFEPKLRDGLLSHLI